MAEIVDISQIVWGPEHLQQLLDAAGTGAKEITYNGKRTVFQDLDQLLALIDRIRAEINGKCKSQSRRVQMVFYTGQNRC